MEKRKIIQKNIKLYRPESQNYISLHPEMYNWFEQGEIQRDFASLRKKVNGNKALDI